MKLKYIILSFIAALGIFTSCSEDNDPTYLDEIRVSSSYVSLDVNGGSNSITVKTSDSWTLNTEEIPDWLTVSPTSGSAGETTIQFSASSTLDGRTAELHLTSAGRTQNINVIQGLSTVSDATCAEVIAGPDSKTYRVTGVVTRITETATYGNFYINDGTGEVYIYGTKYEGKTKQGALNKLGVEVGDEITVEGPKTTYNGTVELVDVDVVNLNKSLIKVDSTYVAGVASNELPLEGGDLVAYLTCKSNYGVSVEIPESAKSWLSINAINSGTVPTVTFHALANTGGDRSATVVFKTTDGKKNYTSEMTLIQKGAIVKTTCEAFNAAEVNDTQYRIQGVITELYTSDKQGKSFYIADNTGKVLVYRAEGFIEAGAKVGDVVTVVGKRGEYKGNAQMVNGTFESLDYQVETVSIADFRNKADDKEKYYMISGTISEATESGTKNDVTQYGNFNLTDDSGSVYVYGVLKGWGGPKGQFGDLNLTWGDKLTIIAYKTTYKGLVEAVGVYLSSEKQ